MVRIIYNFTYYNLNPNIDMAKSKNELTEKLNASIVVQKIKKDAGLLIKKLDSMSVGSAESYDIAANTLKNLKAFKALAVVEENKILSPLQEAVKATKELFKPFYDEVSRVEIEVKADMLHFSNKQDEAKLKLQEDFDNGKIKKVTTLLGKQSELIRTPNGVSSERSIKVLEIVDEQKIPREYLSPDETKIKKALMNGVIIPGCKLVTKKSIAI